MTNTTRYDKKERRVTFPPEFVGDMIKSDRRRAFNEVFKPLLRPLTQKANDRARAYLFYCMTQYIPVESLPDLKKDYLQAIMPVIKEGRF